MQTSTPLPARVRRAGPEDVSALASLRAEWQGAEVTEPFTNAFADWFEREASQRWWWVAEDPAEAVVGMVNLKVFERMPSPGGSCSRWGYLANLFVRTANRGQGVGAMLLGALQDDSRDAGLVRVVLSPSRQSIPLYERAGFAPADMLLIWQPRLHDDTT